MSSYTIQNPEEVQALEELQHIDEQLYAIEAQKGNLPQLIARLEQEVTHILERKEALQKEITAYKEAIAEHQEKGKAAKALIKQHQEQQEEAQNDQEYELLQATLEEEELNLALCQKRVREYNNMIDRAEQSIVDLEEELTQREQQLAEKKKIMEGIHKANRGQEEDLHAKKKEIVSRLSAELYNLYEAIRNYKKSVVAHIVNGVCTACSVSVPIQLQVEIQKSKQLYCCENCGSLFPYRQEDLLA